MKPRGLFRRRRHALFAHHALDHAARLNSGAVGREIEALGARSFLEWQRRGLELKPPEIIYAFRSLVLDALCKAEASSSARKQKPSASR